MAASIQLGCTKTLEQIWTTISDPKHNTKRFIVIRNDKVIYDRGGTETVLRVLRVQGPPWRTRRWCMR